MHLLNPKPIFLSALLCFYSVILPISLPPFHPHCLHREMSATYTRSELLALGHGPIPRLLPGDYTNLGNLRLLRRMRTSRSRRKKKRKKNEKRLSNTEAALCLINARDLRTFSTSVKVSRLLAKLCPDVLAVTETWFTDAAGDYDARSICPRGYSACRSPGTWYEKTSWVAADWLSSTKIQSRQLYSTSFRISSLSNTSMSAS